MLLLENYISLKYLLPEMTLVLGALLLALPLPRLSFAMSLRSLLFAMTLIASVLLSLLIRPSFGQDLLLCEGMLALDGSAAAMRLYLPLVLLGILPLLGRGGGEDERRVLPRLLLWACALLILAEAANLLCVFVALEAAALLALFPPLKPIEMEARGRRLLTGVISSAFLLYALSWLFGLAATLDLHRLDAALRHADVSVLAVLVLLLCALGAKLLNTIYLPPRRDVSGVLAAALTACVAIVALALFMGRLFHSLEGVALPLGRGTAAGFSVVMLAALSIMLLGNIAALRERDVSRALVHFCVAQAGFLLATAPGDMRLLAVQLFACFLPQALVFLVLGTLPAGAAGRDGSLRGLCRREQSGQGGFATPANDEAARRRGVVLFILLLVLAGLPPGGALLARYWQIGYLWNEAAHAPALLVLLNALLSIGVCLRLALPLWLRRA